MFSLALILLENNDRRCSRSSDPPARPAGFRGEPYGGFEAGSSHPREMQSGREGWRVSLPSLPTGKTDRKSGPVRTNDARGCLNAREVSPWKASPCTAWTERRRRRYASGPSWKGEKESEAATLSDSCESRKKPSIHPKGTRSRYRPAICGSTYRRTANMQRDGERKHGDTQLLSAAEVANMLRLSRLHVQTLAVSRELPGIWLENTLLFHLRDVENYLRTHRKENLAIA